MTDAPQFFHGHASVVFKAFGKTDGLPYCLRRIAGVRWLDQKAIQLTERWSRLKVRFINYAHTHLNACQHPGVVRVLEALTTKEFRDICSLFYSVQSHTHTSPALVVVYSYHPTAETLLQRHFGSRPASIGEPVCE